jgi:hypothetical protein
MEARICFTLWTLVVRLDVACETAELVAIGESVCDRNKIPFAADSGTFSFEETSKEIYNGSTCLQLLLQSRRTTNEKLGLEALHSL